MASFFSLGGSTPHRGRRLVLRSAFEPTPSSLEHTDCRWAFHRRGMAPVVGSQSPVRLFQVCGYGTDPGQSDSGGRSRCPCEGIPEISWKHDYCSAAIPLVIGIYALFFGPGADNILRMPPGEFRFPFQVGAVLLAFSKEESLTALSASRVEVWDEITEP
jgi:hypothetical protein